MYNLSKKNYDEERENIILNVSSKKKLTSAIIEKDYWVCLTLDYLFRKSKWKNKLIFKGGTSLSKSYNLIERFSEDIDLIIDWRELGYKTEEPWETRSNTKQLKFIEDTKQLLFNFLKDVFLPSFKSGMEEELDRELDVFIDKNDLGTVCFKYPSSFEDESILKIIRLEIGALAAWSPSHPTKIKSYIAEIYPTIFSICESIIETTTPERTFWGKATILHQEAFRPENSFIPDRYSRHYYDLYCLANTSVKDKAIAQPELLNEVSYFKSKFYPRNWARYDLAKIGTIKLYPAAHSIERLKKDYKNMSNMIYGSTPSFDELLDFIQKLENEINNSL